MIPALTLSADEIARYRAFARLSKARKIAIVRTLTDEEAARLFYTWEAWARDKQLPPPGQWTIWVILAGRGFGKTRSGAQWIIGRAARNPTARIALVGRTAADVRDVMVEGESGILAYSPPWFRPVYQPSKRRLTWPNGAMATTYSGERPDQLAGPQHTDFWADERSTWLRDETWDQLQFGHRLGADPRGVVTMTPRPTKAVRALLADPTVAVTRGTTYENKENLAEAFWRKIITRYEGTRLGRQELEGLVIDDIDGALWKRDWIERNRRVAHPALKRIVVAIDPPASSQLTSDNPAEAGIIVAGLGIDNHGYQLADYSLVGTPDEWASAALTAYHVFEANLIIGEVNNGGDMVEAIVQNIAKSKGIRHIPFEAVRATRGKQLRAEPVSSLYQRDLIHHVGTFPDCEDQQCNWLPGEKSPDRLDANVWAFTYLMVGSGELTAAEQVADMKARLALAQQHSAAPAHGTLSGRALPQVKRPYWEGG